MDSFGLHYVGELPPQTTGRMSGQRKESEGRAHQSVTFGVSMGHLAQVTPSRQYTYGCPMHIPMMPVHQLDESVNYCTPYRFTQMPPRMQVGANQTKTNPRITIQTNAATQPPPNLEIVRRRRL